MPLVTLYFLIICTYYTNEILKRNSSKFKSIVILHLINEISDQISMKMFNNLNLLHHYNRYYPPI